MMRWIPLSESLPREDQRVLLACAYFDSDGNWRWDTRSINIGYAFKVNDRISCTYQATHWMPLPELPEKDEYHE